MTDWFRSWHGAPTDPKWLGIAKRVGVAPGIVASVVWALMDRASQAEDRGSIEGYDAEGLAAFFGCETEHVDAIVVAMTERGMIIAGRFKSWEKRQPKREDDSSKRVQEHRERKRQQSERDVTHGNAPDTETEKIQKEGANAPLKRARRNWRFGTLAEFEEWYSHYPHKVQRGAAEKAFDEARQIATLAELIAGTLRYVASNPPDYAWRNPATWLNGKGWMDEPAVPPQRKATAPPPGRRLNAVEANLSLRSQEHEPIGAGRDNGDVELLPPDKPGLPGPVADLGKALRWTG